jgi:hypothetical protein
MVFQQFVDVLMHFGNAKPLWMTVSVETAQVLNL